MVPKAGVSTKDRARVTLMITKPHERRQEIHGGVLPREADARVEVV